MVALVQWTRFVSAMGYISYDEFLKLPADALDYIIGIRTADAIRQVGKELRQTKDDAERKKLNTTLMELNSFFDD